MSRIAPWVRWALVLSWLVAAAWTGHALPAQEPASKEAATQEPAAKQEAPPPALTHYMGRRIAPAMSYLGADWLIRAERQKEEDCEQMLKNLGVKRGQTVCDLGAGNGFYTLKLAEMVGPTGKVLAVDIQPEMLRLLKGRAERTGLTNIELILGTVSDPKLPAGKVDLVLLVDVYHEFSHPEPMLRAMRQSLSPTGQIVLVEYREEDPKVPIKPEHKMSKKQVLKELQPNGYKLAREFDGLPWQHMMFFDRDPAADKPAPATNGEPR